MTEYNRDILNQISQEMCTKCRHKYWEACTGPHVEWGVLCCKKVRERYKQLVDEKERLL